MLCGLISALGLSAMTLAAGPVSAVLTGNPGSGEAGFNLGCTYDANPPYSNPADPEHTRLLDRDKPWADWNTTTGLNGADQEVVFDLKTPCSIDRVSMLFDEAAKPAHVDVSVGTTADGPWTTVGRMSKEEQPGNWWTLDIRDVNARYLRLFQKLDVWGWYLREVKIYGNVDNDAAQ